MTDENDEEFEEALSEGAQSKKSKVIKILFDRLIEKGTWPAKKRMIVNSNMVISAIKERNKGSTKKLSTKNPANFLKDFIRKSSCNNNWPSELALKKITARQVYGAGQVFEFVPFVDGDIVPFPDRFDPTPELDILPFQSLTIPVEARKLGRQDEPWLIQVVVSQRLIETHFAVRASGLRIETLAHLQISVKTQPEIDATFVATFQEEGSEKQRAYVTVEAKQASERILEHQIREQVKVAFYFTADLLGDDRVDVVIPIVIKVVPNPNIKLPKERLIYVAQFEKIERAKFNSEYIHSLHEMPLKIQSAGLYEPRPPISGISWRPSKKAPPKKAKSLTPKSVT
jgi:hypothetical protein